MELADFLDTHIVMGLYNSSLSDDSNVKGFVTTDVPEVSNNGSYHVFCVPFCLNTKPINNELTSYIIAPRINTDTGNWITWLRLASSQTANVDEYTAYITNDSSESSTTDGSSFNLKVGTTYVLLFYIQFHSSLSAKLISSTVWPVTVDFTVERDSYVGSNSNSHALALDSTPHITEFSVYTQFVSDVGWSGIARFYEPHYAGIIDFAVHTSVADMLLHPLLGAERYSTFTYNTPESLFKNYLLPPIIAFEGSIYDQSDYFQDIIDLQDIEIASLQADLDAANAQIDILESRVSPTFVSNLTSTYVKLIGMTLFDEDGSFQVPSLLTILGSIVSDFIGDPTKYIDLEEP